MYYWGSCFRGKSHSPRRTAVGHSFNIACVCVARVRMSSIEGSIYLQRVCEQVFSSRLCVSVGNVLAS